MIRFYIPHKKPDEKIVLLLRRHPAIFLAKISFWGLVAVMPLLLYLALSEILLPLFLSPLVFPIMVLFTTVYYLYIWLFALHTFVDYYLDVWIVTNYRLVNIEQKGLFNRTTSEQQLYRIQDITVETKGFFSTMLDFGTVHIQTAGEQARFMFKQIKNPQACANKINILVEEDKKLHQEAEAQPSQTTK